MNLQELHADKSVSAKSISGSVGASVTSIQILKDGLLKEHITKVPALLICVFGEVQYEDETGSVVNLGPGDFHPIEPMVKHWVKGVVDSQLVLAK